MSSICPYFTPMELDGLEPRFGLGLTASDFFSNDRILPRVGNHQMMITGYRRPWAVAHHSSAKEFAKDQKNLHFTKDGGFQALTDVHHFSPSEITVKTVDHTIIVEGKHEERNDGHGSIERHFVRKYVLPKEYDMNSVHSSLSSDGILTIKAPPPAIGSNPEKHVPITHTNLPAHLNVKNNLKSPAVHSNNEAKSPAVQQKK